MINPLGAGSQEFQTPVRDAFGMGAEFSPGEQVVPVKFLELTSSMSPLVSLEEHARLTPN
jgi:hypothetical protein